MQQVDNSSARSDAAGHFYDDPVGSSEVAETDLALAVGTFEIGAK